jgi:peptide deformylase
MSKPMALIGKKNIDVLHTPAQKVEDIDAEIRSLATRMLATCRTQKGYAIAANQIGIPINLVVLASGEGYVNVEIECEGETSLDVEGCLSLPGRRFLVPRFETIQWSGTSITDDISYQDEKTGFEARTWQHENDHLQGKLISEQGYIEYRGSLF